MSKPRLLTTAAIVSALVIPFVVSAEAHHTGTLSSLNFGVRYSSILENRGIVFYRDFQVDPVLGIFLFDDRLEFVGDSIGFRDFVLKDKIRLRSRLVSISDNPLFPDTASVRNGNPDRPDTYEWNTRAEIFLPGYNSEYLSELDFGYAKDISQHHGNYFDLTSKVKLFEILLPKIRTRIEPNLFVSIGWGDDRHNRYFYGPSADANGFNNLSYGLWFAFPDEADRYYPVIQITHFEVLGNKNRSAEFAFSRNEGWLFSFIATADLLE